MILDQETRLASAQALSASGATTDYYDAGSAADMARGEPLAAVFTVTTALAGTSPTAAFSVRTDDNTTFSSEAILATTKTYSALAIGAQVVVPIPPGAERYTRGYVTLGGTTPTVSVDCDILPLSMARVDYDIAHADGVTIV